MKSPEADTGARTSRSRSWSVAWALFFVAAALLCLLAAILKGYGLVNTLSEPWSAGTTADLLLTLAMLVFAAFFIALLRGDLRRKGNEAPS